MFEGEAIQVNKSVAKEPLEADGITQNSTSFTQRSLSDTKESQLTADLIAANPKLKEELSQVIRNIGNRDIFIDKLKEK